MRPIDADALIEKCGGWYVEEGTESGFIGTLKNLLATEPTVQSEPHEGEWEQIQRCARDAQPDLECPFCKHRIGWFDMGRYCAGCGAKLKGGAG